MPFSVVNSRIVCQHAFLKKPVNLENSLIFVGVTMMCDSK